MSIKSVREGGKVVSLTHWPHLTPENIHSTHFFSKTVSIPGL